MIHQLRSATNRWAGVSTVPIRRMPLREVAVKQRARLGGLLKLLLQNRRLRTPGLRWSAREPETSIPIAPDNRVWLCFSTVAGGPKKRRDGGTLHDQSRISTLQGLWRNAFSVSDTTPSTSRPPATKYHLKCTLRGPCSQPPRSPPVCWDL